jgi:hypothetical protein
MSKGVDGGVGIGKGSSLMMRVGKNNRLNQLPVECFKKLLTCTIDRGSV